VRAACALLGPVVRSAPLRAGLRALPWGRHRASARLIAPRREGAG
jgi:hypothetical protein